MASFKPIKTLVDAVFTAKFVPRESQTYQGSQWSCLFVRYLLANL